MTEMTISQAWTQASEQSGLSQVSPEMGVGLTILLGIAEVLWWFGVAWVSRKGYKLFRQKPQVN